MALLPSLDNGKPDRTDTELWLLVSGTTYLLRVVFPHRAPGIRFECLAVAPEETSQCMSIELIHWQEEAACLSFRKAHADDC